MRRAATSLELSSILERIGKALLVEHDKVTRERLPGRWVDLIRYLDEQERRQPEFRDREPDKPKPGH